MTTDRDTYTASDMNELASEFVDECVAHGISGSHVMVCIAFIAWHTGRCYGMTMRETWVRTRQALAVVFAIGEP